MGFFKPKAVKVPQVEETKSEAAKKQRLLETEGGNQGAELGNTQGKSIRKVFGA